MKKSGILRLIEPERQRTRLQPKDIP
uniref:Uncharacterized protein n=1 Tax=Rhizophora mucronata TaxID=61149 RepID=A0A2P2MYH5_RHIMU